MTRLGRARFPVLLVAVATAGVLTAILARSSPPMMEDPGDPGSSFTGHHAAFQVGSIFRDPEDIQDLVNRADAIVVGAVGSVSHELMEAGYDGPPGTSEDPRDLPPPVPPFTYYHIVADEVLLDDGFVESTPFLRVYGVPDPELVDEHSRILFILLRNPDDRSYGAYHWGLLRLDADRVRSSYPVPLPLVESMQPAELVALVREAVPSRTRSDMHDWPRYGAPGD